MKLANIIMLLVVLYPNILFSYDSVIRDDKGNRVGYLDKRNGKLILLIIEANVAAILERMKPLKIIEGILLDT